MKTNHDPASAPEDKFLDNHDQFKENMDKPEVAGLNISPEDKATITSDNGALHQDKRDSDQADAVAQEETRIKNNTFGRSRKSYREIRQRVIKSPAYTPALGELLGIVRPESAPDGQFSDVGPKPVLRGKPLPTGGAELKSSKNGAEAVDIYCKRDGDADFVFLMRVLRFPWVDSRPLLLPGKPEERQYYSQLIRGNQALGQPSDIIKVVVTG